MKKVVKAVVTLTLFALADRILGFLFKIFLSRELGAMSLGIYQIALSMFFVLLTLTTSGVPLIVSKLTAKYRIREDSTSEFGMVAAALIIGVVFSGAVCGALLIFQDFFGNMFATRESMTLLLILLPGVVFSGVYAAFRGNMWGRQQYKTVSIIELCEQLVRIGVCVFLFFIGMDKLKVTALSMSIACGFTALMCCICYFAQKGRLANPKGHIVPLIKQSAPITMIRASNSLVNSLIAIAVPFLLVKQGMSVADSLYIFGSSVGMAFPLLYIPITVVGSLAYVMIPTLSSAMVQNDQKSVRSQIESAISFSIVVAALFVPVFSALGSEIGMFVYNNADSGAFLKTCAWLLIPMSVESITSSMMNSLDLEKSSFINYSIGSVLLFGLMFAFYNSFNINVMIYGLGLSLSVSSILDIRKIYKKSKITLSFLMPLLKSVLLIFPTVFLIRSVYSLVAFMPDILSIALSAGTGLIFFFLLGIVFSLFDLSMLLSRKSSKKSKSKSRNVKNVKMLN